MKTCPLSSTSSTIRFHDLPGSGIPLVFIHGLGCASSCDYPPVAFDEALRGRRCMLVDLLGSGFSDKPPSFGYSVKDHALCILDLVTSLRLTNIDLYGHSMGGAIAIVASSLQTGLVRRLIVSEPSLDPSPSLFIHSIAEQDELVYVSHGHGNTIRSATKEADPVWNVWAGSMSVSSPIAIHRECRSLAEGGAPSWRELLFSLSMPRTVIFGEHSLPHPDHSHFPKAGLAVDVVPEAGHLMAWENPSGLAQAIRRALI